MRTDREQPVVDRSCLRVVLGFAGGNEVDKRLRGQTAISHQGAVDVEHRVQQIFVVAGQKLQIWPLTRRGRPELSVSHRRILRTPFFFLHGEYARQRRDFELGFQIVRRLGRVRILKEDQRQPAFLVDGPVPVAALPSDSRTATSRATGKRFSFRLLPRRPALLPVRRPWCLPGSGLTSPESFLD